ncbi:MAG: DUF3800 domain-containing protein [Bacteroidetes bacterium]|nr:DUF3800 domain-containing protein [Bacteroidota bacterium]
MFLDESGDHSLTIIDPQYPLFVLGGIIVDSDYASGEMTERVRKFKLDVFGDEDLILHTADIARNRNGFERLKDSEFRERFYSELNKLMRDLEYRVVACVIKKDEHLSKYGLAALDPYMLSLDILVERFCFEVGNRADGGLIVAEKRGQPLDSELEIAWLNLKVQGTEYLAAKDISKRISLLNLRDKKANLAGLQLADLVVSPIGRFVLGKSAKEDFRIIERKFRRKWTGDYRGAGLVVLPKE